MAHQADISPRQPWISSSLLWTMAGMALTLFVGIAEFPQWFRHETMILVNADGPLHWRILDLELPRAFGALWPLSMALIMNFAARNEFDRPGNRGMFARLMGIGLGCTILAAWLGAIVLFLMAILYALASKIEVPMTSRGQSYSALVAFLLITIALGPWNGLISSAIYGLVTAVALRLKWQLL